MSKISVSLVIIGSFSIPDSHFFIFPFVTKYGNGKIVFIIFICVSNGGAVPLAVFGCDLRYIMVMVQELNILKVIGVDMVIIPPA